MNNIDFSAFVSEMVKMGEDAQERRPPGLMRRGLQGAAAIGLGSGLGYAGANLLGHMGRRSGIHVPPDLQEILNRGGLAAGALGALGSELLRREYYDYVEREQ